MRRIPGIVTFTLPDAGYVARFLGAARLVSPATSFGGPHTTADRRAQWGDPVPEGLVRLSCGLEDTDDLVADIGQALDEARR
jgi:cystathionine gamma-lyase